MISLIILTTLFLFLLSNNFNSIYEKEEVLISNLITSLMLSISTIGSISIGLIFLELTKLPIIYITLSITALYIFFCKIDSLNISNLFMSTQKIYKIFFNDFSRNKFIILCMFWLYLISFGPINHPDTITTYVGYPYQFFLQNKHFIDGGLHQGILGICDFANLSFIQEGNIWLIRSIQALPIFLIVSIFLLRKTNRILIFVFLTCPVFIQWLTIGKYLFLPDIAITITYLVWSKSKEKNLLLNLLIVILFALSFKISSLIISIPISLHVLFDLIKKKEFFHLNSKPDLTKIYLLAFSIFTLCLILIYRLHITGNPFYPIFNNYFVSNNNQMIEFEAFLRNYMRDNGFPFNLIMTNNINLFGMIIGPATGFFLISITFSNILFQKKRLISVSKFVAICQIILLLSLSQGRSDYFVSPIILMFSGEKHFSKELFNFGNKLSLKKLPYQQLSKFFIILQIIIFSSITLTSGYQTVFSILDYEKYMNRYAYNYELTNILNNYSQEPVMNIGNRTALLFLNKDYIHEDKFTNCINQKVNNNISYCIKTLNPKSIISHIVESDIKEGYLCQKYSTNFTSRNPFSLRKRIFHICNISKT